MSEVDVCIVKPFEDINRKVQLVVFRNEMPFLPPEYGYINRLSNYARDKNCFVVSSLYEENDFLNICIIDSCGEVIGKQSAICLNMRYLNKFKKSQELNIADTKLGKIYLCVDVDIYRPAILRIASFKGCDFIVSSQFFHDADFSMQKILFGPWSEAQANCKFVINSTNIVSSIISPCELTKDKGYSGFISASDEGPVYGSINLGDIKKAYASFPVFDTMNKELYQNNYKELAGK